MPLRQKEKGVMNKNWEKPSLFDISYLWVKQSSTFIDSWMNLKTWISIKASEDHDTYKTGENQDK